MDKSVLALAPSVLFVAAACTGATATSITPAPTLPATATTSPRTERVVIANEGGSREGHTPTAFPGMGTGLFAGDNLNSNFPDGAGVQIYLTFALPPDLDPGEAQLGPDALQISGTPFDDLGTLVAEPVAYADFGPELFDLAAIGPSTPCIVSDGRTVRCDVTEALTVATGSGQSVAQFRLRFEEPADHDGRQDLAMFFRTDSNTNEAGIFELVIDATP